MTQPWHQFYLRDQEGEISRTVFILNPTVILRGDGQGYNCVAHIPGETEDGEGTLEELHFPPETPAAQAQEICAKAVAKAAREVSSSVGLWALVVTFVSLLSVWGATVYSSNFGLAMIVALTVTLQLLEIRSNQETP